MITGIYKITSPVGLIYIGQSGDIHSRWYAYKNFRCKPQKKLYESFMIHGVNNHNFEIIEECEYEKLFIREKYYIDLYKSFEIGLNIKTGGSRPKVKLNKEVKPQRTNLLTEIQTIRFSKKDIEIMEDLKKMRIKPDEFLRIAFREKVQRDLKELIMREQYRNSKEYCPF